MSILVVGATGLVGGQAAQKLRRQGESIRAFVRGGDAHPHSRHDRLDEAVIAAKVWAVVQGTAPEVYLDPEVTGRSRPRAPQCVCTTP